MQEPQPPATADELAGVLAKQLGLRKAEIQGARANTKGKTAYDCACAIVATLLFSGYLVRDIIRQTGRCRGTVNVMLKRQQEPVVKHLRATLSAYKNGRLDFDWHLREQMEALARDWSLPFGPLAAFLRSLGGDQTAPVTDAYLGRMLLAQHPWAAHQLVTMLRNGQHRRTAAHIELHLERYATERRSSAA